MEPEKKELRVGIVGIGNIGRVHAECILAGKIPGMTLSALCDTDAEKRKLIKDAYPGIPVYAEHEKMFASGDTDCVIIATPHRFHPGIAADAFRAGLHVLTEKPAGVDCGSVRKMIRAAEESGKAFGIDFNQRTDPLFLKAREIVGSGQLGVPKRLVWIITNWYRSQAYYDSGDWRATWDGEGGGVLLNQAPHNLDLWQWIFGMPSKIRAFCHEGKYHDIPVEDDATIYAEYGNGASAVFITTTGEYPGTNRLEISGDRGKIVIEHGKLHLYLLSEPEREYCFSAAGRPLPDVTETVYECGQGVPGHELILRNFADHVLHGEPLIAPGCEGLNELMISNAAYLSSWTDDWVTFPPDNARFLEFLEKAVSDSADRQKKSGHASGNGAGGYLDRWKVQW